MITSDEILTQLKNGKSIDDIGNAIAKVLNIANADYIVYQKEQAKQKKVEDFKKIIYALNDWFKTYMPNSTVFQTLDNMSEREVDETIQELFEAFETVDSIGNCFQYLDLDKLLHNDKDYEIKNLKPEVKVSDSDYFGNTLDTFSDFVKQYLNN